MVRHERDVNAGVGYRRDLRRTAGGREVAGAERGHDQRDGHDEEQPRIDDGHFQVGVCADDHPSGHAEEQPEGQSLDDRTVTVPQHHPLYLTRARAQRDADADFAGPVRDDVRLDADDVLPRERGPSLPRAAAVGGLGRCPARRPGRPSHAARGLRGRENARRRAGGTKWRGSCVSSSNGCVEMVQGQGGDRRRASC